MGRRSVWSDERVLAATSHFVPATDEVWRLQRAEDPECRWFRTAVRGAPEPVAGSMQGTYVLTAGGECLGRINSADPERVLAMLEAARARWRGLPTAERHRPAPAAAAPEHRWEDSFPEDGLALVRFARDVGTSPAAPPLRPVNQDTAWFSRRELQGFVPERGEPGASRAVAPALVARLARFSFVDNVRGQTLPFSSKALREQTLQSAVEAVDGDLWTLRLTGRTEATTDGADPGEAYWRSERPWPRSVRLELLGTARWDARRARFDSFQLVAIGTRRGRTTFNGRAGEDPEDLHAIGFLLRMAQPGHRVAPTYVNLYDAAWVKMPE